MARLQGTLQKSVSGDGTEKYGSQDEVQLLLIFVIQLGPYKWFLKEIRFETHRPAVHLFSFITILGNMPSSPKLEIQESQYNKIQVEVLVKFQSFKIFSESSP